MEKQFIVFDWKGKMAHFRQFDANSSSLSYSFPPPTVVMGMIAGLLGIQRDEYYDILGPGVMQIGIQMVSSPRKIMQSVNYIYAINRNDLNMSGDNPHTQIPIELVTAKRFPREELHYRIILQLSDDKIYHELATTLENSRYKYLPYFGSAPFLSWLEWSGPVKKSICIIDKEIIVDTLVSVDAVDLSTLSLEPIDDAMPAFFREHVRRFFTKDRQPGDVIDIIWERNRGKIKARFKKPIYQLELNSDIITVCLI